MTIEERTLLGLAATLLAGARTIARAGVATVGIITAVTLLTPRTFTSEASFLPQLSDPTATSGLAQIAGQFGLSLPAGDPSQSPQFYAELVVSREILSPLLELQFDVDGARAESELRGRRTVALLDMARVRGRTDEIRREKGVKWLRKHVVRVNTSRQTGVVSVTATTKWSDVSKTVVDSIIASLNQFNLKSRQSQARSERAFVEERIADAEARLREAENEFRLFLEQNRVIASSPSLMFERDRIAREVNVRQQVYTSLVQALEQARIAEVRNTPLITVVERPDTPARPDERGWLLRLVGGLLLGFSIGIAKVLVRESSRQLQSESSGEIAAWNDAWLQFRSWVVRPWR